MNNNKRSFEKINSSIWAKVDDVGFMICRNAAYKIVDMVMELSRVLAIIKWHDTQVCGI